MPLPLIGGALAGIVTSLVGIGEKVIDRKIVDENARREAKEAFRAEVLANAHTLELSAAKIIEAEAKSEHKLAAIWRPILMLMITAILTNNFIIAPYVELFFPDYALQLDLPSELWQLLFIGVGGYVVGRSVEKSVKNLKER